jgi:hypothetical protein
MSLPDLRIPAARYVIQRISAEELKRAADIALDQGLYSDSLGALATTRDPIMADAGPLFEAALRELRISLPSKEDALNSLLEQYVQQIAEGVIRAYEGLDLLIRELYYPYIQNENVSQYAGDSRGIHHLLGAYYGYDDLQASPELVSFEGKYGREAVEALDCQVVKLATEWNRERGRARIEKAWVDWNNGMVIALAQSIQKDFAFDQLPLLGDALEEAGCKDENILSHCRLAGKHVHCCWVVDLIVDRDAHVFRTAQASS